MNIIKNKRDFSFKIKKRNNSIVLFVLVVNDSLFIFVVYSGSANGGENPPPCFWNFSSNFLRFWRKLRVTFLSFQRKFIIIFLWYRWQFLAYSLRFQSWILMNFVQYFWWIFFNFRDKFMWIFSLFQKQIAMSFHRFRWKNIIFKIKFNYFIGFLPFELRSFFFSTLYNFDFIFEEYFYKFINLGGFNDANILA